MMAAPIWVKNAVLAKRSQEFFAAISSVRLAVKKAIVETIDATKARRIKK